METFNPPHRPTRRRGDWVGPLISVVPGQRDLYSYDGLNRLTTFARGTLNGTATAITGTAGVTESWSLDALGNWHSNTVNGTTTSRTNSAQNQVMTVGSATLGYDQDGNTLGHEKGTLPFKDMKRGHSHLRPNWRFRRPVVGPQPVLWLTVADGLGLGALGPDAVTMLQPQVETDGIAVRLHGGQHLLDLLCRVELGPAESPSSLVVVKAGQDVQVVVVETGDQYVDPVADQRHDDGDEGDEGDPPQLRRESDRVPVHQGFGQGQLVAASTRRRPAFVIALDVPTVLPLPPPARVTAKPRAKRVAPDVIPGVPPAAHAATVTCDADVANP